jgi:hypothetical protein
MGSAPYPGESRNLFIAQKVLELSRDYFVKHTQPYERFTDQRQPCLVEPSDSCGDAQQTLIDNLAILVTMNIVPWDIFKTLYPNIEDASLSAKAISLAEFYHRDTNQALSSDTIEVKVLVMKELSAISFLNNVEAHLNNLKPILVRVAVKNLNDKLPPTLVTQLTKKINSIIFAGDCKVSALPHDTSSLFTYNLFYHPPTNTFKACVGAGVANTSVFSLVYNTAHEMSHALSPCGLDIEYLDRGYNAVDFFNYPRNAGLSERIAAYPFSKIVKTLMGRSIQNFFVGLEDGFESEPMCSVGGNVLDESVADAFATEVLIEFMKDFRGKLSALNFANGFANTFRFACGPGFDEASTHPSARDRLNKIILGNPQVKTLMKCPTN